MQRLTSQGQKKINDIAQQYNVSTDAVMTLLQAVNNGNGTMAQFNHPELGGSGQWMSGGMITVSDMSNNNLKSMVDGICIKLSNLLAEQPFVPAPLNGSQNMGRQQQQQVGHGVPNTNDNNESLSHWWPIELGVPTMTGVQNNICYAYFATQKRLAIEINRQVTLFDTLAHQLSGISQQQGGGSSITFTSQHGMVDVFNLPVISSTELAETQTPSASANEPNSTDKVSAESSANEPDSTDSVLVEPSNANLPDSTSSVPIETNISSETAPASSPNLVPETDIFATIERLALLRQKDVITEEEFVAKKTELLSRL